MNNNKPDPSALPDVIRSLPELLAWRVAATPQAEAYRQFDAQRKSWVSWSWAAFGERVALWSRALGRLALPRGARVAILLPNSMDAVSIDQAVLAQACVPVPLHAIDNPASIAYILADSEASVLVASTLEQWQAIAALGQPLPQLREVVLRDLAPGQTVESAPVPVPVLALADWLARAEAAAPAAP
ncbi:MAG TPA: AMP-binding protein, partial [Methylibium sp.]